MKKLMMMLLLTLSLVSCGGGSEQTPEEKAATGNNLVTEINSLGLELYASGVNITSSYDDYSGTEDLATMKDLLNKLTVYIQKANEVLSISNDDDVYFADHYTLERYRDNANRFHSLLQGKIQAVELRIARETRVRHSKETFDKLFYNLKKAGFSFKYSSKILYNSNKYEKGYEAIEKFVKGIKSIRSDLLMDQYKYIYSAEEIQENKGMIAVAHLDYLKDQYESERRNSYNYSSDAYKLIALYKSLMNLNKEARDAKIIFPGQLNEFDKVLQYSESEAESIKSKYLQLTGEELKLEVENSEEGISGLDVA